MDDIQTWSFAQDACESKNANLVTINSEAKQIEIDSLIGTSIWIGFRLVNDDFQWVSGAEKNYLNWDSSEPNNYSGNEKCVVSQNEEWSSAWNDSNCDNELSFICETTSFSGNNN